MIDLKELKKQFTHLDFREKRTGLFKILIPFFHEDGDMYDLFLEESPDNKSMLRLSDYGLTLMKLSYDFAFDSEHKKQVLTDIVLKNQCKIEDGNIFLDINPSQFEAGVFQIIQVLSKVSNIDIINRESMKSYFYEFLEEFITENFSGFQIEKQVSAIPNDDLIVDYKITTKERPMFLFGVNDNTKASKVIITCLTAQNKQVPHRSLVVYEDFDALSSFNRKRLTNVADKQFTSFSEFQNGGLQYLQRESA